MVCKWRNYVPFCIKPMHHKIFAWIPFLTLLHSQGPNSWKMLLLLLILVFFFFSCAWICVKIDNVSWLLCSIFGNNTFSLLYYHLFVYACAYISHGYFYQYNFLLGILSYLSFFPIFYFMYILFKCRTNLWNDDGSVLENVLKDAQCGLFWPYSFRFALHPAIADEVTCNWIGSTYWTKELKVACSGCHQNVSATSCLLFESVKDVFMEHACWIAFQNLVLLTTLRGASKWTFIRTRQPVLQLQGNPDNR